MTYGDLINGMLEGSVRENALAECKKKEEIFNGRHKLLIACLCLRRGALQGHEYWDSVDELVQKGMFGKKITEKIEKDFPQFSTPNIFAHAQRAFDLAVESCHRFSELICPFCEGVQSENETFHPEANEDGHTSCECCGEMFHLQKQVIVFYTTSKTKEENER